uniref:Aspartic proteinase Asp1 n=1 Tax=Kalanchoe fedtschenkoi TaxID=63787 RepID=A0A7N0TB76_KALFE
MEFAKLTTFRTINLASLLLLIIFLSSKTISMSSATANKAQNSERKPQSSGPTAVFPVQGNVYPDGVYSVALKIGKRSQPYILDIDTGSDLTWLQCDAPCVHCTKKPPYLYKPYNNLVRCNDAMCSAIQTSNSDPCTDAQEQCDYEVEYADQGTSLGVLVADNFQLQFTNGSRLSPRLVFGCGYDQQFPNSHNPPTTDGVLGLGAGKSSIMSQMQEMGLTRHVFGHCFSGRGGGFLFFGDKIVPSSGVTWVPMGSTGEYIDTHYSPGPAELLFDEQSTGAKGLLMIFDSGSSYTYFNAIAYKAALSAVRKGLSGKPLKDAVEDQSLPICWKSTKPFKSVQDVKSYFKPFQLKFSKTKNVQLEIPPEAYLVITKHGNACLGILNGAEVGFDSLNIIGDNFFQDKLVVYNNEKQQIGWTSTNCYLPSML